MVRFALSCLEPVCKMRAAVSVTPHLISRRPSDMPLQTPVTASYVFTDSCVSVPLVFVIRPVWDLLGAYGALTGMTFMLLYRQASYVIQPLLRQTP